MKVDLAFGFFLTDERGESSCEGPVLVNQGTGEAYEAADFIEPYIDWGFQPAARAVARMARMRKHTKEEMEFIKRF